jgi:hypothetical protein
MRKRVRERSTMIKIRPLVGFRIPLQAGVVEDAALPPNRVGEPGSAERIAAYQNAIDDGFGIFETRYGVPLK